jgi:hypothetical protein
MRDVEYEVVIVISQVWFSGGVNIGVAPTDEIHVDVINVACK